MAGSKREDTKKIMMIGKISRDLQRLHDKAPEAHAEIVTLSRDISRIINVYMLGNTNHKNRNDLFEGRFQKEE